MPVFAADGRDYQPYVAGGSAVSDGKYPFMVSIQADASKARSHKEHFCGGSLKDRNSVLTVAYCVDFIGAVNTPATLSYRDVRIVVGGPCSTANTAGGVTSRGLLTSPSTRTTTEGRAASTTPR